LHRLSGRYRRAGLRRLLVELKARFDLTYIFISHDLNVVRFISDRVMVMYLGKVVELGPVARIYREPRHPYTQALLSAMPSMNPRRRTVAAPLSGDPPNPINPPSGCRFRTRCPFAESVCAAVPPNRYRYATLEGKVYGVTRLLKYKASPGIFAGATSRRLRG
jgi:peptide/nickel transport system ATP-binding protein